jgi:hypothetical protein
MDIRPRPIVPPDERLFADLAPGLTEPPGDPADRFIVEMSTKDGGPKDAKGRKKRPRVDK